MMKRNNAATHLTIRLILFLGCSLCGLFAASAQEMISAKEKQLIEEVAIERVKVFTQYFACLSKEKDEHKRKLFYKYIALSFKQQEEPLRVLNNLLPASVIEKNPLLDLYLPLPQFLEQTTENYQNNLSVNFDEFQLQHICYSEYLGQYYAVVSARRHLSGMYRKATKLYENSSIEEVDFFVELEIEGDAVNIGALIGFAPHQPRDHHQQVKVVDNLSMVRTETGEPFRETLKLENPKRKVRIKRGKHHVLRWSGGFKDDIIEVVLIPAQEKLSADTVYFDPLINTRSASLEIRKSIRTGLYKFRIKNITTGRYTQTGYVRIKKKYLLFGALDKDAHLLLPPGGFKVPEQLLGESQISVYQHLLNSTI